MTFLFMMIMVIIQLQLKQHCKTLILKDGVKEIEEHCFIYNRKIRSVTIPETVKIFGKTWGTRLSRENLKFSR